MFCKMFLGNLEVLTHIDHVTLGNGDLRLFDWKEHWWQSIIDHHLLHILYWGSCMQIWECALIENWTCDLLVPVSVLNCWVTPTGRNTFFMLPSTRIYLYWKESQKQYISFLLRWSMSCVLAYNGCHIEMLSPTACVAI